MRHQNNQRRRSKRLSSRLTTALAVLLLALAGATGCSDKGKSQKPAAAPAQQPKSVMTSTLTGTVASVKPEEKPAEIYTYNPAGRRDPFMPIIVKEEKKALVGSKAPLERYPVNEFKLAGIVWGGLGYHAMLEGPDGKGYFIRVGTKIGPNQGVVKKITPTTMIVEERFKDPTGELSRKEIIIELRKKQEGIP